MDGRIEHLGRLAALKVIARLRGEPDDVPTSPPFEFTRGLAEVATAKAPEPARIIPSKIQAPTPTSVREDKPQ